MLLNLRMIFLLIKFKLFLSLFSAFAISNALQTLGLMYNFCAKESSEGFSRQHGRQNNVQGPRHPRQISCLHVKGRASCAPRDSLPLHLLRLHSSVEALHNDMGFTDRSAWGFLYPIANYLYPGCVIIRIQA